MNQAIKNAQAKALKALQAAKAVKEEFKAQPKSEWPEAKQQEFDLFMADFATANTEVNTLKAEHEQSQLLETNLTSYTQAASGSFSGGPTLDGRGPSVQTPEKRAQAVQAHKSAFKRYILGQPLTRNEYSAYMATSRDMFGNNAGETLASMLPAEQFALVGNVDSLGGFLVPEDFMTEFVRELTGYTVVRPLARVRPTVRNAASFLTVASSGNDVYTSGVSGAWRGEGWVTGGAALPTQDQPRFGRERVPVHIWCPDLIELTMELLEDSAVNIDAEVRNLLAEVRAIDEDSAFLLGTGIGQPKGILREAADGNITTVETEADAGQTYEGLVKLFTSLPAQYRQRSTFVMNSLTLGLLMLLEDTEGHHIFPPNSVPTQLFTRPIAVSEFIPDGNVNGNHSMILGDFSYYAIADRMDMRIVRLVERFAPNVAIMAVARVGGQVLKTNPFRIQVVNET